MLEAERIVATLLIRHDQIRGHYCHMVMTREQKEATEMVRSATQVALQYFRGKLGIEFKSDESPVTQADRAVETELREILQSQYPSHAIFGEEFGIDRRDGRDMWIIDPIDGTRSFISGLPLFGILLSRLRDNIPQLSAVGLPCLDECFTAERGHGAFLNGDPIRCSDQSNLDEATLYIGEGEKIWRSDPACFARLMQTGRTRRFAYDCYPYGLLSMGTVDAVVDMDLQPYDYLPVSLLVEEAGGKITDWQGNPLKMDEGVSVAAAATPALHDQLLRRLAG